MENREGEEMKTKFIRQVYQMIYEHKFEELINLIKVNYPSFANNKAVSFPIPLPAPVIIAVLFFKRIKALLVFYISSTLLILNSYCEFWILNCEFFNLQSSIFNLNLLTCFHAKM